MELRLERDRKTGEVLLTGIVPSSRRPIEGGYLEGGQTEHSLSRFALASFLVSIR